MTHIKFCKKQEHFISLEVTGHTDYDKSGQDILCSAISSISQSLALGILKVLELKAKYKTKDGMLKLELPHNLTDQQLKETDILFKTAYLSLQDLQRGYSKFINLEVEDVY